MAELCGHCKRPVKDIGHMPCQGRHSMRKHGREGDAACATVYAEQGYRVAKALPHTPDENFGSFG